MHGNLLDEKIPVQNATFLTKVHKRHAIPFKEIALSFMKRPIKVGLRASGMVPESLIYRKFCFLANLSCVSQPTGSGALRRCWIIRPLPATLDRFALLCPRHHFRAAVSGPPGAIFLYVYRSE
jgi:hypothetical protein